MSLNLAFEEYGDDNDTIDEQINSLASSAETEASESEQNYENLYTQGAYFADGQINTHVDPDVLKYQKEKQQAEFDDVFRDKALPDDAKTADESSITVTSDISEKEQRDLDEFHDNLKKITVDTYEWIVGLENEATELINKVCDQKTPRRTYKDPYTNKDGSIYPKANFSKPRTEQSASHTIKLLAMAGGVLGLFFGVQGNNYYEYSDGKVTSNVSCILNSLLIEDMPMASSVNMGVFITGIVMGLLIVAAIYGIYLLESSTNKASRIGHEHGSAHLAKSTDYKTFKNKFMEK